MSTNYRVDASWWQIREVETAASQCGRRDSIKRPIDTIESTAKITRESKTRREEISLKSTQA